MTSRWWTPSRAHLQPDAFDYALLQPGTDPRYDLGAALFAVHRAGAAACRAAAEGPILDELALVESLAVSRGYLVPQAVDAVSKCVSDGDGFLKAVYDAAEHSALDLFRSAVAKGVAPPVAAERVGMVYGVPADALGDYHRLATVPGTSLPVLSDAADAVLFGYFAVLSDQQVAQDVSKAEAWRTQPRNEDGEFSRTAQLTRFDPALQEQLSRVGTVPSEESPLQQKVQREVRQKREKREKREVREKRPVREPAKQEAKAKGRLQRTDSRKPMAQTKAMPGIIRTDARQTMKRIDQQAERIGNQEIQAKSTDRGARPRDVYFDLDEPLSHVVSSVQVRQLLDKVSTKGGRGWVSGQDIIDAAGDANRAGDAEDQRLVAEQATHLNRLTGEQKPYASVHERAFAKEHQRSIKEHLAQTIIEDDGEDFEDENERLMAIDGLAEETIPMSLWSPDHDVDHSRVAFVVSDPNYTPPQINVVLVTGAEGFIEGDRHSQYRINPYQRFEVITPDAAYDEEHGVVVNVHGFTAVGYIDDEEVAKADWRSQPRDEDGEWVKTRTRGGTMDLSALLAEVPETVEPEVHETRQRREKRQVREVRQTRQSERKTLQRRPLTRARQDTRTPQRADSRVALRTDVRQRLERSLVKIANERKPEPKGRSLGRIYEDHDHVVMDLHSLHVLLMQKGMDGPDAWGAITDGDDILLDHAAQASFMNNVPIKGTEVDYALRFNTEVQIEQNEGDDEGIDLFGHAVYVDADDEDSVDSLVSDIYDRFEDDGALASVRIEPVGDNYVRVMGNSQPVTDQVVVEYDEDLDLDDDALLLSYVGTFRSADITTEVTDVLDPTTGHGPYNVGVRYYRLTNPGYRHYRARAK